MSTLAPPQPKASATAPARHAPEGRDVALLVATRGDGQIAHHRFGDLPRLLSPGDLLVVNTSATLPAALTGMLDGQSVFVHLSTRLRGEAWVIELRGNDLARHRRPPLPGVVELPGHAEARLLEAYEGSARLTVAQITASEPIESYLRRYGQPIRYAHDDRARPIADYQTVFARHPGSAEMPSAGRPFTSRLITDLATSGVLFAPVTLHAGVSSLEQGERPYPERYEVPASTARLVNAVRTWGGRVIAVGTTVVRALETVAAPDGTVVAADGSTGLVVTPERGLRAIDGLITGWHEPQSSHQHLLEAAAGTGLLRRSYDAARACGYRWHEFGDSHLIIS